MMKRIFFLVEEESIRPIIRAIMDKIVGADDDEISYEIRPHQGKLDLQGALPKILPAISKIPDARIMILQDQDEEECKQLKSKILDKIRGKCTCPYKVRIVCRELEGWYFGDLEAVEKAFPRFKADKYSGKAKYRNPDNIKNANKELLQIIPEYEKNTILPKIQTAELISAHLEVDKNNSLSFKYFISAIKELME